MRTPISQAEQFEGLVAWLCKALVSPEQFTVGYNAETSEFIRFNRAKCARPVWFSRPALASS